MLSFNKLNREKTRNTNVLLYSNMKLHHILPPHFTKHNIQNWIMASVFLGALYFPFPLLFFFENNNTKSFCCSDKQGGNGHTCKTSLSEPIWRSFCVCVCVCARAFRGNRSFHGEVIHVQIRNMGKRRPVLNRAESYWSNHTLRCKSIAWDVVVGLNSI